MVGLLFQEAREAFQAIEAHRVVGLEAQVHPKAMVAGVEVALAVQVQGTFRVPILQVERRLSIVMAVRLGLQKILTCKIPITIRLRQVTSRHISKI